MSVKKEYKVGKVVFRGQIMDMDTARIIIAEKLANDDKFKALLRDVSVYNSNSLEGDIQDAKMSMAFEVAHLKELNGNSGSFKIIIEREIESLGEYISGLEQEKEVVLQRKEECKHRQCTLALFSM